MYNKIKEKPCGTRVWEDYTMTDRTLNQIAEMKKQTIGVEVEMNSIRRDKAAKLAAEYFGTERFADTAR